MYEGGPFPRAIYLGFIEVMVLPDLDLTNSLLMNRPLGCEYLRPFGAVSSTKRSDMPFLVLWYLHKGQRLALGARSVEAREESNGSNGKRGEEALREMG
jgi:hypothetical protein